MNNPENYNKPKKNELNIQEAIQNLILSNPLFFLSTVSVIVGGIIFWLYYSEIQYFPDLSFNESFLFLLVAAITGFITILYIAFTFMTPYLVLWWPYGHNNKNGYPHSSDKKNDHSSELIGFFLSILFVCLAVVLLFFLNSKLDFHFLIVWGIPSFIFLAVLFQRYKIYSQESWDWKKLKPRKANKEMFVRWLISTLIMLVILTLFIMPTARIIGTNDSGYYEFTVLFLMIIVAGNLSFAFFRETGKTQWHWIIPILMVFLVFFLVRDPVIPKLVMKVYKFGNFVPNHLLVDAESCEFLKNLELTPNSLENDNTCNVQNIKILSRLGSFFYIESICKPPWLCTPIRFTIPTNKILSWSITTPST